MALSYQSTTLRNQMVSVVADALNGGKIEFQDATDQVLGTCTFDADAFAQPSAGSVTANTIGNEDSANPGTVTKAVFYNQGGDPQFTADAGDGDGVDMQFNRAALNDGDLISVTSLTYAAPS